MAIKIPSKNIYQINNPKVRDNLIDNVNVAKTVVSPKNEYKIDVYNEKHNIIGYDEYITPQAFRHNPEVNLFGTTDGNYIYATAILAEKLVLKSTATITILVPKLQDNSYVSDIYYGKNKEGNPNIGYTLYGIKEYGNYKEYSSWETSTNDFFTVTGLKRGSPTYDSISRTEKIEPISISSNLENSYVFHKDDFVGLPQNFKDLLPDALSVVMSTTDGELYYEDKKDVFNSEPYENEEYYSLDIVFMGEIVEIKANGVGHSGRASQSAGVAGGPFTLKGTYEKHIVKNVEVTVYGNTIGIDVTDGSITYIKDSNGNIVEGSGSKPYSLNGNELLQDSATRSGKAVTERIAGDVLEKYKNGKETATLLCDIADYYDENHKLINIKGSKMSFALHDKVIPYVLGADGIDVPMSRKQDGSPKVFEVVGTNIIYDGAVWQELRLLETD